MDGVKQAHHHGATIAPAKPASEKRQARKSKQPRQGLLQSEGAVPSVLAARHRAGHLEVHPQVVAGIVQALR